MINFCLLFLVLMAVRRIMWLISSELMCILEDKIKFIFYIAVAAVMFFVDISAATKTEKNMLACSKAYAKQCIKVKKNAVKKNKHAKKVKSFFALLEPVSIERTQAVKRSIANEDCSRAA